MISYEDINILYRRRKDREKKYVGLRRFHGLRWGTAVYNLENDYFLVNDFVRVYRHHYEVSPFKIDNYLSRSLVNTVYAITGVYLRRVSNKLTMLCVDKVSNTLITGAFIVNKNRKIINKSKIYYKYIHDRKRSKQVKEILSLARCVARIRSSNNEPRRIYRVIHASPSEVLHNGKFDPTRIQSVPSFYNYNGHCILWKLEWKILKKKRFVL